MRLLTALLVAGSAFAFSTAAFAHKNFPPFTNSTLKADLATEAGMEAWREAVSRAGGASLVYADWHLQNFMKSEFFAKLLPATATDRSDDAACEALRNSAIRKFDLSGRPDANDNHLLARMSFDLERLPAFTVIGCEAVISAGQEGLRIRGFFYVPDYRIETANEYGFVPLDVEPSRLPNGFFH